MAQRGSDMSYASVAKGKTANAVAMEKDNLKASSPVDTVHELPKRTWASLFIERNKENRPELGSSEQQMTLENGSTVAEPESGPPGQSEPNAVDQNPPLPTETPQVANASPYPPNYQVPNPYLMPMNNNMQYEMDSRFMPYVQMPMYSYQQPPVYSMPSQSMYMPGSMAPMISTSQSCSYTPFLQQAPNYSYYQAGNVYYNPYIASTAAQIHNYVQSIPSQFPHGLVNVHIMQSANDASTRPAQPPPVEKKANGKVDSWNNAVASWEREHIIREKVGLLINRRYRIVQKINVGSYGAIYTALDIMDPRHTLVAVKFETANVEDSHLKYEHEVYKVCHDGPRSKKFKFTTGFPRVFWIGEEYNYKVMVMELLGPSLENLFTYCSSRFRKETVYELGMQMLSRVEHLHSRGFVHRDLKPENFLMGLGCMENTCYLIDFGLARRFRDGGELTHVPYRKGKSLVGTAKYASLNSHNGLELSRRDDIESLGYILLEFMIGELPWKETRNRARFRTKQQSYNRIRAGKEQLDWDAVCPALTKWIKDARSIEFTEKPDYDHFRGFLKDYLLDESESITVSDQFMNMSLREFGPNASKQKSMFGNDASSTSGVSSDTKNSEIRDNTLTEDDSDSVDLTTKGLPKDVAQCVVQKRFEWLQRRESSASEKYTYECLYRWTLPYGQEPTLPPDYQSSMSFGYGFGEGGFA